MWCESCGDLVVGERQVVVFLEQPDQRHHDGRARAQTRSGRRVRVQEDVVARAGGIAQPADRGLHQVEPPVEDRRLVHGVVDRQSEVGRLDPDLTVAAGPEQAVGVAVDGRVQHQSALTGRERRHVGAAAGKADSKGCAGAYVHRRVAAQPNGRLPRRVPEPHCRSSRRGAHQRVRRAHHAQLVRGADIRRRRSPAGGAAHRRLQQAVPGPGDRLPRTAALAARRAGDLEHAGRQPDHRPGIPAHLRRHSQGSRSGGHQVGHCAEEPHQRDGAVGQLDREDDRRPTPTSRSRCAARGTRRPWSRPSPR